MMLSNKVSRKQRRIKVVSWTRLITISFLFLVLFSVLLVRISLMPVNNAHGEQILIVVSQNDSTSQIAHLLEEKGAIRSALAFRLYARINGLDGSLKTGAYNLDTNMSVSQIVQELIAGSSEKIKITFPEGYTVNQIVNLLDQKGIADKESLLKAINEKWDYSFLNEELVSRWGVEGYLYPDTYYLGYDTKAEEVVDMMLVKFNEVIEENDYAQRVEAGGLTLHEAVTIASMVEREARVEDERPRIAGVIFNRLRLGMPLQIDATVQYALGTPKEKLYNKDLEIDSPYNTYKINGLPPGPIANPGWPSLLAVNEPEKNNYLYYVAKPDGTHAFAITWAEHIRNVQMYQ